MACQLDVGLTWNLANLENLELTHLPPAAQNLAQGVHPRHQRPRLTRPESQDTPLCNEHAS